MSVTTMRIDDRLIHGQIVTRWIADAQADTILIWQQVMQHSRCF